MWDVVSTTDLLCYDAGRYVHRIELSDDSMKIVVNGDLLSVPSQIGAASTAAGSPQSPPSLHVSKLGIRGHWVTSSSRESLVALS